MPRVARASVFRPVQDVVGIDATEAQIGKRRALAGEHELHVSQYTIPSSIGLPWQKVVVQHSSVTDLWARRPLITSPFRHNATSWFSFTSRPKHWLVPRLEKRPEFPGKGVEAFVLPKDIVRLNGLGTRARSPSPVLWH